MRAPAWSTSPSSLWTSSSAKVAASAFHAAKARGECWKSSTVLLAAGAESEESRRWSASRAYCICRVWPKRSATPAFAVWDKRLPTQFLARCDGSVTNMSHTFTNARAQPRYAPNWLPTRSMPTSAAAARSVLRSAPRTLSSGLPSQHITSSWTNASGAAAVWMPVVSTPSSNNERRCWHA